MDGIGKGDSEDRLKSAVGDGHVQIIALLSISLPK